MHKHPYEPFLFESATKLIVGTLPPPRFTTGELREGDVNFCYGSRDGQLWRVLDRIFDLNLKYETTEAAVAQRKEFLRARKIGICDIVESAKREKMDALDAGMQDIELRDLLGVLQRYPRVDTLLFTGGNSKNGPEYFFRKLLKPTGIRLEAVVDEIPRIHEFELSDSAASLPGRRIRTVSLMAPSGSANRAVGSLAVYKAAKDKNPDYNTFDYRVDQYRRFF